LLLFLDVNKNRTAVLTQAYRTFSILPPVSFLPSKFASRRLLKKEVKNTLSTVFHRVQRILFVAQSRLKDAASYFE
jgi:hypothetical protein